MYSCRSPLASCDRYSKRVVLPLGNGGVAHLFVIYGYQGAESDPEKLALLASVLAQTNVCCSGQPVVLVVDLSADPMVIPSLAKAWPMGLGLMWKERVLLVKE